VPKIVDHGQRRGEVLEATWRVIRRGGLEAATVREIAREAGFSNGVLAHYFADKDDILVQAHKMAFDRVYDRVSHQRDAVSGIELLRTMLYEALPLDEDRFVEAVVDMSFLGMALNNPKLRQVRLESARRAHGWWAEALASLRDAGVLNPNVDVDLTADNLMAMVDGISIDAVLFPEVMSVTRQRELADDMVMRLQP
jgi:AcrR family transcriptional regulator